MATTVMTVEFGTIHHYSSLEENLKLVYVYYLFSSSSTKCECLIAKAKISAARPESATTTIGVPCVTAL